MYKQVFSLFASLLLLSNAWGDDSVEAAAIGNIVFEKAPELVMLDETLAINKSANKKIGSEKFSIDVDFHFKNISDHDVTRKIAFVLPPVKCRMDENSLWKGLDTHENNEMPSDGLKDFTTTVDGKSQKLTTRTEAYLDQKNITTLLDSLHIPLNPCLVQSTVNSKPNAKYSNDLQKHHLLTETNDAAWSENIYFEWTQTFPAGKIINIHHHYTPVIGESVLAPRSLNEFDNGLFKNEKVIWNKKPETFFESNKNLIVIDKSLNNEKRLCIMPAWVEYQLTTGANWNNGIGIFKLIVNDESHSLFAINQFYKKEDQVKADIKNNKMVFTTNHFIPTKNLQVLFISLPSDTEELKSCGL